MQRNREFELLWFERQLLNSWYEADLKKREARLTANTIKSKK